MLSSIRINHISTKVKGNIDQNWFSKFNVLPALVGGNIPASAEVSFDSLLNTLFRVEILVHKVVTRMTTIRDALTCL